ncbi:MAG: hypothetical protein ACE5GU_13920 [Candidatus Scalinduaceae bacterium]
MAENDTLLLFISFPWYCPHGMQTGLPAAGRESDPDFRQDMFSSFVVP